jgi:hypothetical protein
VVVSLIIIGAITGASHKSSSSGANINGAPVTSPVDATPAAPAASPTTPATPSSSFTESQQNAVQAAQNYLQIEGFSKQGLIDQLSSSAGDGYSLNDATVAVDSLQVDSNAQAVRSAKDYIQMEPFSCQDLVQQLDSSAGSQYTEAQAQYAAHSVGIC